MYASLTWLAGVALRQRNVRVARAEDRSAALERDHRDAQAAVAEERARMASELHDVVAHGVSVMTVQAGAARMMLTTDPDRAVAPLLAVEETGRQALDELRRLLSILRPDQARSGLMPQPGLENLPELAESVRGTGLPVDLVIGGERPSCAARPGADRVPDRAGGPDQHAEARLRASGPGPGRLRPRSAGGRGERRRMRQLRWHRSFGRTARSRDLLDA